MMRAQLANARNEIKMLGYSIYESRTFLPPTTVARFQKLGLEDPARQILEDLERQNHFLPEQEGWTFRFHGTSSFLIDPDLVLGGFDDGHREGYALMQYEVKEGGVITWKQLCVTAP